MTIWEILLIAVGLAMDCFAVALCTGTSELRKTPRMVLRVAFHFGLFQGGMTYLGWLAGRQIADLISRFDHWIAFLLLLWVGGRMIAGSLKNDTECWNGDATRGRTLVVLSIATSIDALAIGLSLALIDGSILKNSLIIGVTSFLLAVAGYLLGDSLGRRFGKRMEFVGGVILVAIGIKVLVSHLFGI